MQCVNKARFPGLLFNHSCSPDLERGTLLYVPSCGALPLFRFRVTVIGSYVTPYLYEMYDEFNSAAYRRLIVLVRGVQPEEQMTLSSLEVAVALGEFVGWDHSVRGYLIALTRWTCPYEPEHL